MGGFIGFRVKCYGVSGVIIGFWPDGPLTADTDRRCRDEGKELRHLLVLLSGLLGQESYNPKGSEGSDPRVRGPLVIVILE